MQVSVETTVGLGRKLKVSVPSAKLEEEVDNRLNDLAKKVSLDGFRPGKVPLRVVRQRYSASVREEVAREMVQSTLYEALKEHDLTPAGSPHIEPGEINKDSDFSYTATFEIFPTIEFKELENNEIDTIKAEVSDKDVDAMLEKLQEQHMNYQESDKEAEQGDKLVIDFEGFVDGEAFEGGKAEDFELQLGSNSMIPGFEEGLKGLKPGDETELNVTFPENYGHKDLAGKPALFKVTVKKVLKGEKPELNEEFVKKFNIESGKLEDLKKDIKDNMTRELKRQVKQKNKEVVFDAFINANPVELPSALVDREVEVMQQDMVKRVFGDKKMDPSKLPELPRDMFESQAKRRVHLGLLVSEYVQKHGIKAEAERVDSLLDELATSYQKPQELKDYYHANKDRMAEIEAAVIEDMVVEKILSFANEKEVSMDYESVMNPKSPQEEETEEKDA